MGYRDLDGQFYDAAGQVSTGGEIVNRQSGKPDPLSPVITDDVFEDYELQWTVMPRIGASFPILEQTLFFAHYDVTSQRLYEQAYNGLNEFFQATQGGGRTLQNPDLKPIKTIEYDDPGQAPVVEFRLQCSGHVLQRKAHRIRV